MADAVISGLVSNILLKLTSLPIQEIGLRWRLKDDFPTLENNSNKILLVLKDAEKKHVNEKDVELFLKRLTSILFNVENVLDDVLTEATTQKMNEESSNKARIFSLWSSNSFHNRNRSEKIAYKFKTIRRELDAIVAEIVDLKLAYGVVAMDVGVFSEMPNRETSARIHSSRIIFGRTEEMETVVEKICSKDVEGSVYAICGKGGSGKTTLARLVYNHERVNTHFDLKSWINVSENLQVHELMKRIVESVDKRRCTMFLVETMLDHLQKQLRGKRFFIVLDDVWIQDSDYEKWVELISKTLDFGAKGSIVLVTTRSKEPELQHELRCLSGEDSWALFAHFSFAAGRKGGDISELEPIGKKIVEKCQGLPLALMALGSLMWSKTSSSDWESVTKNDILALKFCYDNLLPHIKQCFAYCCLFPKGYKMEKDLLILLWMANGLIPDKGDGNWFTLGEEIIDCLVWRSFFQVDNGKYVTHNVMHDLSQYAMRHICSVIEPGNRLFDLEHVFHLSSSSPDFVFSDEAFEKMRSLRSLIIFNRYKGSINRIFDLGYLRVLYLVSFGSRTLPESIGNLKHLKYLNLSGSEIEELPDSITYLRNLQVLILELCLSLRNLPEGLRYMRNLQVLNLNKCFSFRYFPPGIKELTRICILPYFLIGKKNEARIDELADLDLLELGISGLNNLGGLTEAKNANLKHKRNLSVLKLDWLHTRFDLTDPEVISREEEVLEGLEPNPRLVDLEISRWFGKICRLTWIHNLKNLVKIRFHMCSNCEQIPPLGKLPSLKVVTMYAMDSLKCFHEDDNVRSEDNVLFPVLQTLDINMCRNLVFLPSSFPKLEVLRLWECRELVSLPDNLPNLAKLHITDCNGLRFLPDDIQSFKDLNEVKIRRCENLSMKYEKEVGVGWPKISHVSNIDIA